MDPIDSVLNNNSNGQQNKDLMKIEDLKWLMSSQKGRRIVKRWLLDCGIFNSTFNTNALTMAYSEGSRSNGLNLLNEINTHCPELYVPMINEVLENDE